eukprot:gene11049-10094_t
MMERMMVGGMSRQGTAEDMIVDRLVVEEASRWGVTEG